MLNWKYIVAGFCIPINVFFIIFGIIIGDPFSIVLGLMCLALVSTPIAQDYYAKKEEAKTPEDKRSSS